MYDARYRRDYFKFVSTLIWFPGRLTALIGYWWAGHIDIYGLLIIYLFFELRYYYAFRWLYFSLMDEITAAVWRPLGYCTTFIITIDDATGISLRHHYLTSFKITYRASILRAKLYRLPKIIYRQMAASIINSRNGQKQYAARCYFLLMLGLKCLAAMKNDAWFSLLTLLLFDRFYKYNSRA